MLPQTLPIFNVLHDTVAAGRALLGRFGPGRQNLSFCTKVHYLADLCPTVLSVLAARLHSRLQNHPMEYQNHTTQ